ncbi:hypothetical protein UFOVP247_78 [uncultured Caudovirales phage]|uniref:Uncharacterized protein n=1 Tax=uncultured Caudovirales phage TaxID=2100421 RepID=A0A6J7WSW2_9CAUD|nr:hypothetical protein UFOVP247_78 [uncultured Caudovirales phage]
MYEVKDAHKLMDELYRPFTSKDTTLLSEQVKEEMISKGLNPINKDDVLEFWASKGIKVHGELHVSK